MHTRDCIIRLLYDVQMYACAMLLFLLSRNHTTALTCGIKFFMLHGVIYRQWLGQFDCGIKL